MRTLLVGHLGIGTIRLDAGESHHLLRVLRAAPGDAVRLVDGSGHEALGTVTSVSAGEAEVLATELRSSAPAPTRIVLLGVPRPALLDEALLLGTETGATAFWLLPADRSQVHAVRGERLARVVDAAIKQCGRTDRPSIREFSSLTGALAALAPDLARFAATPGGGAAPPVGGGAAVAVGPEGGWSPGEAAWLAESGFAPLGLGPHVLRAPTAVAAALVALGSAP